jgi:hypothetical protein
MITPNDVFMAHKVRKAGFRHALRIVLEAKGAGLPLSYALASIEMESFRGFNVFGHDPVRNPIKGGVVTKSRYLQYKQYRREGLGMQGVGPMQLTWWATQDHADKLGGCWKVKYNLRVGFRMLASLIHHKGVHNGVRAYNGSEIYAERWAVKQRHWHNYIAS